MVTSTSRRQRTWVLLLVGPLVTLTVTPWMSYDPINIPKMALLATCAVLVLALLILDFRFFFKSQFRTTVVVSAIFFLDLLIVLLVGSTPFIEQFFGTNGRNTGYLTYVALLILFFAVVVTFDKSNSKNLLWCLLGTGGISIFYGLAQSVGIDPVNWVNSYSPVIGTLGNPDFQSSFLGICGVGAVALLLRAKDRLKVRASLSVFLALLLYVILKTKAQQGYLILAAGSAFVVFIYIYKSQRLKKIGIPYAVLSILLSVLVLAGSLNKGPLAHFLYKLSVAYRGDYWNAAWKMTIQHPLAGVGLDSYGDWYRATRSVAATLRRGPEVVSNAAHNVLLDFSSNGGFPLLIAYLLIVGLVLTSGIRVVRRSRDFDVTHAGIFGAWIAYQIQSLISLNQLGLAVWGWILSGALIAYEITSRTNEQTDSVKRVKGRVSKGGKENLQTTSPAVSVAIFIGFAVALAVALPPFLADARFRTSLSSGNAAILQKAATGWPIDDFRLIQASQLFTRSKLESQALVLAQLAAKRDPRLYYAWQAIYSNTTSTVAQKSGALRRMKFLDPHNPNLK